MRARLAALLPALLRFFELERPDLVCLHQQRTSCHQLAHFVARELGIHVLWSGDGLLPHTLQIDEEGLDGAARCSRRPAYVYRGLDGDDRFLGSVLAAVVSRSQPPGLTRRTLQVPPLRQRLRDALHGLLHRHEHGCLGALDAWRLAAPIEPPPPRRIELPSAEFVTVLLQRDDDDRLRLDCAAPPTPRALVTAARSAARHLDRDMQVVAVLPRGGLLGRELSPLRRLAGVHLVTAEAAVEAAVAAVAVITVNDGGAAAGLIAGTPVVHCGAAAYGVRGVATAGRIDSLTADVVRAMADDQPELRKRVLTWLFAHGHIWCSSEQPDHNGIAGFVLEIERRLAGHGATGGRIRYRAGPAWPLAAEGRS